ncbi:MAG TPA: hypothetical protein VEH07_11345 [Alphaproteobacteria bacterium]|nr:hypothetical protein [Alphaproteobacteria bacterium]
MPFKFEVLPSSQLCILCCSGRMSSEDFDAIWRVTENDSNFTTELDMLTVLGPDADYSEVVSQMSEQHARKYVERHSVNEQRKLKRSAHICANERQVAMVKMFAAYIEAWGGPPKVELKCFSELEPALAWMEQSEGRERRIDRDRVVQILRKMGHGWCCKSGREIAS